jgi:hypothetical protein
MTLNLLNSLYEEQLKLYNLNNINLSTNYKYLTEECINSLLFIIYYLELNGHTLTHINLNDFKVYEQYLFLVNDKNVVALENNEYVYVPSIKENIEFIPKGILKKNNKNVLYKSVGLFVYYLLTHKIKNKLTENDLNVLYYSKPYYFIKNTINNDPCLIYI